MTDRALFFFPHNPYPPRGGAHQRCLQMADGLKRSGIATTLASSTLSSETAWTAGSIAALTSRWVADVRVYEPDAPDYLYVARLKKRRLTANGTGADWSASDDMISLQLDLCSPPGMRAWFERLYQEIHPDAILMSYAFWDGLVDHERFVDATRLVDVLDLFSLNMRMRQALTPYLDGIQLSASAIDDEVVRDDFYDRLHLGAHPAEYRVFDRYDSTIAISQREASVITAHTGHTDVAHVPMTYEPRAIQNTYAGPALFPIGPHPFNVQGYLYAVKRVLPLVREHAPDFSLAVTGAWYRDVRPLAEPGVSVRGFIPDLEPLYRSARCAISPVFGGTGQSVKIVEAMAHGVPVVALAASAKGSPIRHGVNGFVATTAGDFAACVIRLWQDRELCRRLGEAARQTIAAEYSPSALAERLAPLLAARRDKQCRR